MVRSPCTFEIRVASNLEFQREIATPSSSGRMTSMGSSAIASSRKRTERPRAGSFILPARSDIPSRAFAVDGLARDAKPARGFLAVATGLFQNRKNVPALQVFQAVGGGRLAVASRPGEIIRECAENQRAFDQVTQFPHIARPVITRQRGADRTVDD